MIPKRDKIISATIKLFAKEGITVATARIAKEAGISNGSLFNYFPSKQILIDEVYLQIKTEIANCVLNDVSKTKTLQKFLFSVWQSYILWAIANPLKYNVAGLLRASKAISVEANNKSEEIFKVAKDRIRQGVAEKQIIDIDFDYYCELVSAQIMAAISYSKLKKLEGKALEKHISQGFSIYWNGITKSNL